MKNTKNNSNLVENGYYWIKLEFNWVIGQYYNKLFQITTGEFIGFKSIYEIDYNQIKR